MKKIAVTGGISSGKSTACRFFQDLGAYYISADQIVHELLNSDAQVKQKVSTLLGMDILKKNELSKKAIAEKVFFQENLLDSLEKILHPLVWNEIQRQYNLIKDSDIYSLFVVEVPLLYKTDIIQWFDAVIEIQADIKIRQERSLIPTKQFTKRASLQKHEKLIPDFVVVNNHNLKSLFNQIQTITKKLV